MMARILYIQPTTKSVVLTTLPHIVDYSGAPVKTSLTQYDKGDIIEEARVLYTDHKRGAYLKIQDGITALASVRITCLNLSNVGTYMKYKGWNFMCNLIKPNQINYMADEHLYIHSLLDLHIIQQFNSIRGPQGATIYK